MLYFRFDHYMGSLLFFEAHRDVLTTARVQFPGDVGGGRKPYSHGKPFWVKARSRIGTCLAEPVCAKGLNGTCQENYAETCGEQDHSFHRRRRLIWTGALSQQSVSRGRETRRELAECQHRRVLATRTAQ
jgi:hypothetical protein